MRFPPSTARNKKATAFRGGFIFDSRCERANRSERRLRLREVLRDVFLHLEHGDRLFVAEDRLQLVVGVDRLLVLETVLLDVLPELRDDFLARERSRADDFGEL